LGLRRSFDGRDDLRGVKFAHRNRGLCEVKGLPAAAIVRLLMEVLLQDRRR
jgi:hypothetical protein